MARYVFLTWSGAGNQPPAIALAQALRSRGHDVAFAGYENQRTYFTARGFRFVILERASATWRNDEPERMFAIKMRSAWAAPGHLDDVPQLISQERCNVLVVDCMMFGALAAAETAGVPTSVLVHSAPGALMPPHGEFEARFHGPVNAVRAMAGRPKLRNMWDAWGPFPALCNTIGELDPLWSRAPKSVVYLGPLFEQGPASTWTPPWPTSDTRPLVLASFSTGPYWDQRSRIERTLKALEHHHCRVLVTQASLDATSLDVPANAVVVGHLPHSEILPHTAVTVTHAGHGTVTASLSHGVPLLCLPNPVADQPILAAQVQALGAGRALDGEQATSAEIATAIRQLLDTTSYAANARRLGEALAAAPGIPAAVSCVERLAAAGP